MTILEVASRKVLKTLNFQIKGVHPDKVQPVGVKLSADGKYGFVALGPANHVAVIDAKTFEILDYLLVGRRVWQMAFTPDQKQLLATNGVSGDVSVIDVDSLKVIKSVKSGVIPGAWWSRHERPGRQRPELCLRCPSGAEPGRFQSGPGAFCRVAGAQRGGQIDPDRPSHPTL